MKKFILIDGHAILHRAFHALPPLTNAKGEMTNAVYGFFSMFLKILEGQKPDFIAVCFDRPKPTFRKLLYVGYQAHRPKMSDELGPQIGIVHEILEKAKVAIFELDGYEADDLIGTISVQVRSENSLRSLRQFDNSSKVPSVKNMSHAKAPRKFSKDTSDGGKVERNEALDSFEVEVIIVSGDRDLLQLVNSHVKVLAPIVGITNMTLFDEQRVKEKYGIKPSQFIDYKALVGDASDNYPGVSGIGPKTAVELLKKYNTFESLYQNIKELPPKIAEKIGIDAEQASLAKKLATIITDAPIKIKLDCCQISEVNIVKMEEAFEEQGFKSLIKRISNSFSIKKEEIKEEKNDQQLGLL